MWARSHTSGLMMGSTWRSSWAAERWPTRSRVRRRTCSMASTVSARMRIKPYGGRSYTDVNDRVAPYIVAGAARLPDGDNPTFGHRRSAWSGAGPLGTFRGVPPGRRRPLSLKEPLSARQHLCRASRPLERAASQDGDLGLDRLRDR